MYNEMIDSKNTLLLTNTQLIYYTNMGPTLLIENVLLTRNKTG